MKKNAGIIGLGLWTSDVVRTNDAWPESFVRAFREQRHARLSRDFVFIEGATKERPYDALFVKHALPYDSDPFKGATLRRATPSDVPTATCDARALSAALADARVGEEEVDLVLSSALVPDRLAPSNGPAATFEAGCRRAPGVGVEGFCSSALIQLELATALVESGRARFVACVQSHHIARLEDFDGPSSPIFGDASSAFVVGEVPANRGVSFIVRGAEGSLARGVTYTRRDSPPDTPWWAGNAGPIVPGTDDPAAMRTIAREVLHWPIETIRELCRVAALPLDAVSAVAAIQPMVWYSAALAEGLGISPERVPTTYGAYAHIGPCGVIANLLEARRRGLLRSGAPAILYAHGAGITRYAALVRWHGSG